MVRPLLTLLLPRTLSRTLLLLPTVVPTLSSTLLSLRRPLVSLPSTFSATGTIVLVGLPAGAYAKSEVFSHVIKTISIKGSYVGNRADSAEAIDFFTRGLVKSPIKIVGLSELEDVYELMEKGQIVGSYVLDTSK